MGVLAASVGKSRTAVLRRNEQRRSFLYERRRSRRIPRFAPPICRRRWRNNAFPLRQLRRRRRQPSEHRSERKRAIKHRAIARAAQILGRHLRVVVFVAVCVSVLAVPAPAMAAPPLPTPAGWPLRGAPVVQRGFAPPAVAWAPGHRGVDLVAKPGEAILAAASGTVRFAGSIAGKPVVSIDHGSVRTTYEPVVSSLSVGERVVLGQVIGYSGRVDIVVAASTGGSGTVEVTSIRCCCWALAVAGCGWWRSLSVRSSNAKHRLAPRQPLPQLRPAQS
jgi:hypothetical protein